MADTVETSAVQLTVDEIRTLITNLAMNIASDGDDTVINYRIDRLNYLSRRLKAILARPDEPEVKLVKTEAKPVAVEPKPAAAVGWGAPNAPQT